MEVHANNCIAVAAGRALTSRPTQKAQVRGHRSIHFEVKHLYGVTVQRKTAPASLPPGVYPDGEASQLPDPRNNLIRCLAVKQLRHSDTGDLDAALAKKL